MNRLWESCPGDGCLWVAAEILLQATAVILAAWLLAHTAARRRAAMRHGIWLCALVFVLLSPATALLMNGAGLATFVVPVPAGPSPEPLAVTLAAALAVDPAANPAIAVDGPSESSLATAPQRGENALPDIRGRAMEPAPPDEFQAEPSSSATVAAPSAVFWLRGGAATALGIWAAGALCLLARLLWRHRALRRLLRAVCPVEDARVPEILEKIGRSLGAKRLPRVLVWRGAAVQITPVTVGAFRPVVVLSAALLQSLGADQLREVLIHECAHVLRRDPLVGLMQRIVGIAFWPHPLVHLMNRELARAREEVCDNYVLRYSDGPQYAQTLFDLAQRFVPLSGQLAQLGLLQPCWRLEHRVAGLLDPGRNTVTQLHRLPALMLAAAFLAIALLTAGTRFVQAEPQPADPAAAAASEKPAPPPQPADVRTVLQQNPGDATLPPVPPEGLIYTCRVTEKGTGKPIAGATVTVRPRIVAPYRPRTLEARKYPTDALGKCTFTIPPEQAAERGLYIALNVACPGYASRDDYGDSLNMIRKVETTGERPFFEHVELTPVEPLWGTVVLPDGRPATGIKVIGFSTADPSLPARPKTLISAAINVIGFSKAEPRDWGSVSRVDTTTDQQGAFHVSVAQGSDLVFWLLPKDFAPATHVVLKKRGDLGKFVLQKGIVVKGRVVDQQEKPLAGLWVEAGVRGGPAKKEYAIPATDLLRRSALTDSKGEFTLAPLPASGYVIGVEESPKDGLIEERTFRIPPAVFHPQPLVLAEGETTKWVELHALPEVPQVRVEGQCRDNRGKPWSESGVRVTPFVRGDHNGLHSYMGHVDAGGKFVIRAPKGLRRARLDFLKDQHSALRVRMKKTDPLSNRSRGIQLGTLEQDVAGIEVVRYEAPILLIKAVAEDGTPLQDAKMDIEYAQDRRPLGQFRLTDRRDVQISRHRDGRVYTLGLLPDEEFTVTVSAEGCKPKSETLKLAEGAVRALEVKLSKGSGAAAEKPAPAPRPAGAKAVPPRKPGERQEAAIAALKKLGGDASSERVAFRNSEIADADLIHLKDMTNVTLVSFIGCRKVTDAGVAHLKGLKNLETLYLPYTSVGDAGVKKLQQALPGCRIRS